MGIRLILKFLSEILKNRLDKELNNSTFKYPELKIKDLEPSKLNSVILNNNLTINEIVILFLALIPHISPGFLNQIIEKYFPNGGNFPEFGGATGKNHRGIIPTGETALYIIAGNDVDLRLQVAQIFSEEHLFAKKGVLYLEDVQEGEPKMSGRLIMDEEYVELFTTGKISRPKLSSDFPAQLITTGLNWEDLVLRRETLKEIDEIETWLHHNDTLLNDWKMKDKIKPGFKVLFSGPPGTGKTFTAALLGKKTKRDVFRIDLSLVVSKYIGETEKNLSKLFDKAQHKDWILFFDEADSVFGRRTNVRDAHDKYANQEVSYLLQRIESHPGLIILATNFKGNIDFAFTRRFNSIIEFKNPDENERLILWKKYLPEKANVEFEIIEKLAGKFEITGANIVNVVHYASLQTLMKKADKTDVEDLLAGIKKEYDKEGKMISNLKSKDLTNNK